MLGVLRPHGAHHAPHAAPDNDDGGATADSDEAAEAAAEAATAGAAVRRRAMRCLESNLALRGGRPNVTAARNKGNQSMSEQVNSKNCTYHAGL